MRRAPLSFRGIDNKPITPLRAQNDRPSDQVADSACADPSRVITRFFVPGEENRIRDIIERLCRIPCVEVETIVERLQRNFQPLHPDIEDVFLKHFEMVAHYLPNEVQPSDPLRRLIGACFTMEYANESAALFNPSMVPAIDQTGLPSGSMRFVMSLRYG